MNTRKYLIIGGGVPLAIVALFLVINWTGSRSFESITDDAWNTTGHPMISIGATVAVIGWTVAATTCFVGWRLRGDTMLAWLAGFSVWLLIDDAFSLHEYWMPTYVAAGDRGEKLMLLAQVVVLTYILVRHPIRNGRLLAWTGVVFIIGLAADHHPSSFAPHWLVYVDDGAKLVGIGLWAAWCASITLSTVTVPEQVLEHQPD